MRVSKRVVGSRYIANLNVISTGGGDEVDHGRRIETADMAAMH